MTILILLLIYSYKKFISSGISPACRFVPTCSDYAIQALKKYGTVKGGFMACKRLLRCNRFCKSCYDPVE